MIFNVRGTNGSGKSTLVRKVLDKFPHQPIYGILGPKKPEAYRLKIDKLFNGSVYDPFPEPGIVQSKFLYLLGPYQTPAGGADCIQPYDNIPPLIEKYAQKGHVMFEGVLISKSKGTVGVCLEQWGKQSVLLFLDTSLEDCIDAVKQRRTDRDDTREFNSKNLVEAFKAVQRVRKTLLNEDIVRVVDVSRGNGLPVILDLLREARCG